MKKLMIFLMGISLVYGGIVHISSNFVEPQDNVITYSGSVVAFIEDDNVHLWASTLTVSKYAEDWRKIKAEGLVSVETTSMIATSDVLDYDIKDKRGKLSGNTVVFLSDEDATVITESLNFDLDRGIYSSYTRNTMFRKDVEATSNIFTYEGSSMVLKGEVEATSGETRLFGGKAVINLDENIMEVSGNVRAILKDATITGEKLAYDMDKEGTFTGNVTADITREKSRMKVVSEYLKFDTGRGRYSGWNSSGKVKIWKGKTYSESNEFNYFKDNGTAELIGDVYVYDEEKNIKLWAERVLIYLDKDEMKAFKARTEIVTK